MYNLIANKWVFSFCLIMVCCSFIPLSAQENTETEPTKNVTFYLGADIVSRYIWRGLPSSLSPNIQPSMTLGIKNFEVGAWASYAIPGEYAEIDLNVSYTLGAFKFSIWDYYNEDETNMSLNDYFRYKDTDTTLTSHALEGTIEFGGTDAFPLSVTLATFFHGYDKDGPRDKNYYSTYLELGYEHSIGNTTLSYFAGGTFGEGYYATKGALVNVGITASREFKLSETTSIPIYGSLIVNPNAKDIFFVFGITL